MEFRSQDIAQLVLGYLKEIRCKKAFMELLYNSHYLQEAADNYRKSGFIITRVAGLSLIEYLKEYAAVYTIVQERLEASEYYRENHPPRSSLVKQILYLLDNGCIQSRTSTPIQDRPTPLTSDNIPSEVYNVQDTSGEAHKSLDRISIGTTPINRLHNNSYQGSSILCKSNDNSKETVSTCDKSTSTDNEVDPKEKSHEKCEEIFTNTFLENVELIEKLADNINKEVSSKCSVELDSSAIESIVQRTETDPILVQLISELIDPENVTEIDVSSEECNKSTADENPSNLSIPVSRKNMTPTSMIDNSVKRRLRSTTKLQSHKPRDSLIDDQNNDAVESIIAASFLSENQNFDSTSCPKSGELLLTTAQCHNHNPAIYTTPTDTNTVYTNTGNVLMIQPSANVANSQILPQKTLNLDSSRPCYIIGNQPFVNVSIPPTPLKVGGLLSEQDILTMPTIFVCDNSQQYGNTQTVVVPTSAPAQTHTKTYKNIAPKVTSDKAQSISEYITLYKCSESSPYKVASPKSCFQDQEVATNHKSNMNIYQTITEEEVAAEELQHAVVKTVINKEQEVENSINKLNSDTACVSSVMLSSNNVKTPSVKITENSESTGSNVKSNSHVRQLHFSSPEKVGSSMKTERVSSKTVRTSLFQSSVPNDEGHEERTNGKIELGEKSKNKPSEILNNQDLIPSWDANLRGFKSLSPVTNSSEVVTKNKRKRQEDSLLLTSSSKKCNKDEDNILILELDLNNASVSSQVGENKPITPGTLKNRKSNAKRTEKINLKKSHVKNKKRKNPNVAASKETISDKVSDIKNVDDTEKSKNEIFALDKEQEMMNRVIKSRINKKCNIDNVKKLAVTDEIILTSVPKIKSCEILKEESILILSSKLNQDNETAPEIEHHTIVEHNVLSTCKNIVNEESGTIMNPPLTSKSLPILETPIKNSITLTPIPKTPGLATSTLIETPFTKAVIDQLTGIDITSIPTPKFPITPNFAFTPAPSHSPVSNRGTDYSTCSSYYQPSDSEQNKSLEQLIQECQRLEKQENLSNVKESTKDIKKHDALKETLIRPIKVAQKNEDSTEEQKEKQIPLTENSKASIAKLFVEKRKAFNENILGKKNMQLAKMLSDEASDENMSSSESNTSKNDSVSSSSGEDSESSSCSCSKSPTKKSPYSLRPRKTSYKNENQDLPATKQECSNQGVTTRKGEKPRTYQNEVLNKMEEKRQRTIAKLKSNNANVKQKTPAVKQKAISKVRKRSVKNTSVEGYTKPTNEIADTVKSSNNDVKIISNQLIAKSRVLRLNSDTRDSSIEAVETPKLNVQSLSDTVKEINTNIEIPNATTNDTSSNNLEAKQSDAKIDEQKSESNKVINNNELNKVPIINLPHEKIECVIESNCAPSPEQEEIVLHLSSDDDNLQPYEMVETELLESSVSSTPAFEYKSENVRDLKNSEMEDDKIVDKEAELVRGLKQWGIHLIPNKLVKNSLSVVETKEKNPKQETGRNTKDKSIKTQEEDSSLEDGEILSPVKSDSQKKSFDLMGNVGKTSHNTKRRAPENDSKLTKKEIPALNKLSSSTSKELIKDKMNTKTNLEKKGIEQGSVTTVKPDFSIQFDTKTFERETIEISHDYNSKSCRKLSDYNFEILNKKFAANVYIEEIGEEVEKLLSFTRFNFIFELSPESYGNINKKKPVKLKNTSIKKRSRPLNTLYNQLLKNEETAHISPLDNLYTPSNSSRENRYNSNKHKDNKEKVHLEHSKNNKSEENAFPKKYSKDDERSKKIRDDRVRNSIQHDKIDKLKLHSDETQLEHKGKKEENHNLQTFPTCGKSPNKQCTITNNEKVDDIQIESLYNSTENVETECDDTVKNSEDYLMNYALVGSERINEDDDLSCDKRKRSSLEEQSEKVEDKKKKTEVCQELLRSIDVDSFLKQLHGDM
ncbi:hypothetical protein RI129_001099 [Pyrocoelia pectoralis]|uniref:Uncharacterized protein n=1 Tax=Pyrocoelia pectoralis TaxID=417401 RepID=A0AAN7VM11_9COLE